MPLNIVGNTLYLGFNTVNTVYKIHYVSRRHLSRSMTLIGTFFYEN